MLYKKHEEVALSRNTSDEVSRQKLVVLTCHIYYLPNSEVCSLRTIKPVSVKMSKHLPWPQKFIKALIAITIILKFEQSRVSDQTISSYWVLENTLLTLWHERFLPAFCSGMILALPLLFFFFFQGLRGKEMRRIFHICSTLIEVTEA